uniref:Coiled-coil domain containing 90B n=1 Tax=Meleagris gallopavo TaxID=9103 RepID=G1NQQ7_MELGA
MNYTSQHPSRARPEERSGGGCVVGEAGWVGPEAGCSHRSEEMTGGGYSASLFGRVGRAWPGPFSAWVPQPPRALLSPLPRRGLAATHPRKSYDVRRVEITPPEQRKVTFDTHALVRDLETHGFAKEQAETIVSALITLSNVSLETVYKDMVTQAQQEITLQQIMAHLDSIRKDMVILEKSEFANLRAENEKMKIELDQVKQQLMNETSKIQADSKLDINLERSRVTDMFTDQERKLMEATTEFHKKDSNTNSIISEISNKIDTEIASLKTLMESNKLDTIRYLAGNGDGFRLLKQRTSLQLLSSNRLNLLHRKTGFKNMMVWLGKV